MQDMYLNAQGLPRKRTSEVERDSSILRDFLAQQSKVVDFGQTTLYKKFVAGHNVD